VYYAIDPEWDKSAPPIRRGQLGAANSAPGHFGAASVKLHYKSQPNAKTQSKDKNYLFHCMSWRELSVYSLCKVLDRMVVNLCGTFISIDSSPLHSSDRSRHFNFSGVTVVIVVAEVLKHVTLLWRHFQVVWASKLQFVFF